MRYFEIAIPRETFLAEVDRLLRRRWQVDRPKRKYWWQSRRFCQRVEESPRRPYHLENDHGIPGAHKILHSRGVPVGEANTTVARGAANGLGIIRAVNADAGFVQAHPENADQIVRAGRKIVKIFRAHTVIKHAFVIPEPRPNGHTENFPCAHRRRQRRGAGRDGKNTNQLVSIEYFEKMLVCIDKNLARSECGILRDFAFGEFFNFERQNVRHFERVADLKVFPVFSGIELLNVGFGRMKTLGHEFQQRRVRHPF